MIGDILIGVGIGLISVALFGFIWGYITGYRQKKQEKKIKKENE